MSNTFLDMIKQRRTQYSLGKNLPLSQEETAFLIKEAVRLAPSSFNSQSSRVVILFGHQSDKLWSIAKETLRKIVPAETFAATEAKMNAFAAGAGTILFYEDQDTVKELQTKFAAYAQNFPVWSEQSSGMAQFAVWSALASSNIGASLQHYNPLIDTEVAATWSIPSAWVLRAQMPFGSNEKDFAEKSFIADETRFRVYG